MSEWITSKQAVERLGVCKSTLWVYIRRGLLEVRQAVPHGKVRVSAKSIDALLTKRK